MASEAESAASSAVEEATSAAEEASSAESGAAPTGKIGVILPDTKSSIRWESFDRPLLGEAFEAAGVEYEIQNAEGDKNRMATIADQMITSGATVLMITNLDSESGAAIEQKAADAGVKTIDYDRLTLNGLADVYVSFDGVKVGEAQGDGLIKCITDKGVENPAIAVLNGSPTDNNATLFKQGYDSKINPKFDAGEWTEVDDQSVPDWDNQKGGQIYEQMLTKANGKIDGVLAANDGLANAVIAVNKKNNLQIPVTGQDATPEGLRNILAGDQCMTVYKAVKDQAAAAAAAAVALLSGQEPDTGGTTIEDTESGRQVPAVLLDVQPIFKEQREGRHRRRLRQARGRLHPGARRRVRRGGHPVARQAVGSTRQHRGRPLPSGRPLHVRRGSESVQQAGNGQPILELKAINKSFGPVHVLHDVDFTVYPGQVTALVGDNGAGKSTMVKCVTGVYTTDSGEILFEGQPVAIHGPKDAAALGIEVVYQDLALADNLDIVQNMFLGREMKNWQGLDEPHMEVMARKTLSDLSVRTVQSVRQLVASPLRRSAADRGDRQGRPLELPGRPPRRAHRRPRRRADARRCSTSSSGSRSRASAS